MSKYNPNGKSSDDRALVQMWDDWQQSVRLDPIQHLKRNKIPFVYEYSPIIGFEIIAIS